MKLDKIDELTNNFCKLATLLSDMAHRTMFGLMPKDSFDFIAGRWAAEGAKKLIIYGLKAVRDELYHYKYEKQYPEMQYSFGQFGPDKFDKYIEYLQKAAKLFNDKSGWDVGFGSKNWAGISIALANIVYAYKKYKETENDTAEQEQAIRNLLVKINIFDGLAHNSGTIYTKLVLRQGVNNPEELKGIERLRDLSESENPYDVLKEIEKDLDITLPYKDQLSKMRQSPDYWENRDAEIKRHLEKVKQRKRQKVLISQYIEMLEERVYNINKIIKDLTVMNNAAKRAGQRILTKDVVVQLGTSVMSIIQDISNKNVGMLRNVPLTLLERDRNKLQDLSGISVDDYINNIKELVYQAYNIINPAADTIAKIMQQTRKSSYPLQDNEITTLVTGIYSFINQSKASINQVEQIIKILEQLRQAI